MNILNKLIAVFLVALCSTAVFAGNVDRVGQAGATELLMNPWARSSGVHGLNSSFVSGAEAIRLNVAGLANGDYKTEVILARTLWLQGSEVGISSLGFSQKMGASGKLGISLMSLNLAEEEQTTTSLPEGTGAAFRIQFFNMGISYARAFTSSINGGLTLRVINESIDNLSATGVAIDAGIQYVTGPRDNVHFGIALRNVGTPMRFSGDGLAFKGKSPNEEFDQTIQQRSEKFELPSMLNVGVAYDFYLDNEKENPNHRLTTMGNFTSHSFSNDQIGLGAEYALKERFMFRLGYRYENGLLDDAERTNAHTGLAAGFTFELPLKENGPTIGIDYSYRTSNPYNGSHALGLRLTL